MATQSNLNLHSDLEGEEAGGFVVMNLNASMAKPFQILEHEGGGYFETLEEARAACRRWREEADNPDIFIYALIGVRQALGLDPGSFALA